MRCLALSLLMAIITGLVAVESVTILPARELETMTSEDLRGTVMRLYAAISERDKALNGAQLTIVNLRTEIDELRERVAILDGTLRSAPAGPVVPPAPPKPVDASAP